MYLNYAPIANFEIASNAVQSLTNIKCRGRLAYSIIPILFTNFFIFIVFPDYYLPFETILLALSSAMAFFSLVLFALFIFTRKQYHVDSKKYVELCITKLTN